MVLGLQVPSSSRVWLLASKHEQRLVLRAVWALLLSVYFGVRYRLTWSFPTSHLTFANNSRSLPSITGTKLEYDKANQARDKYMCTAP